MRDQDRDKVIETLRLHFTSVTDGDAELLWQQVRGQELADVIRALQEHRLDCGRSAYRPDIRIVHAKAMGYRQAKHKKHSTQQKTVSWIRNPGAVVKRDCKFGCCHNPTIPNPAEHHGVADATVIYTHYSNTWAELAENGDVDDYGKEMARAFILAHCRNALMEIGSPHADAMARDAVGLDAGESITGGKMFRKPPIEPAERTAAAVAEMEARRQHAIS